MPVRWEWECPVCGSGSKKCVSHCYAQANGKQHLRNVHNEYELYPIMKKELEK